MRQTRCRHKCGAFLSSLLIVSVQALAGVGCVDRLFASPAVQAAAGGPTQSCCGGKHPDGFVAEGGGCDCPLQCCVDGDLETVAAAGAAQQRVQPVSMLLAERLTYACPSTRQVTRGRPRPAARGLPFFLIECSLLL